MKRARREDGGIVKQQKKGNRTVSGAGGKHKLVRGRSEEVGNGVRRGEGDGEAGKDNEPTEKEGKR